MSFGAQNDDELYDIDSLGRNKVRNRRYSIVDTINETVSTINLEEDNAGYDNELDHQNSENHELDSNVVHKIIDKRRFSAFDSSDKKQYTRRHSAIDERLISRLKTKLTNDSTREKKSVTEKFELCDELKSTTIGEELCIKYKNLSDLEITQLVFSGNVSLSKIESIVGDLKRAVQIRRSIIETKTESSDAFNKIPYKDYDYSQIFECCCENTIGYIQIPLGIVGPIKINNKSYHVPMATTEGCLIASTNRGCCVLTESGGVKAYITDDGMTRGPVMHFPSAGRAVDAYNWLLIKENFESFKTAFNSTSRYARLVSIKPKVLGRYLYIRIKATTGNAMGMNMISKGTEAALQTITTNFPDIELSCISGNYCTDKKSSFDNFNEGRGKSVICECVVPEHVVQTVLKTTVNNLVSLNTSKNLIGSSIAGTIGGYNTHAANTVAAIFIATGQDAAQVVCSSNCVTIMETCAKSNDLYISCTMPSIEVGTIGGGTHLNCQRACREILGLSDCSCEELAQVICGTVMASEVSTLAALCTDDLVKSHMNLNRGKSKHN